MKKSHLMLVIPSSGLSLEEVERLDHLIEEASEVIKEASKIKKHGFNSRNPTIPDSPTNKENLETELSQLLLATQRMHEHGDIDFDIDSVRKVFPEMWEQKKKYFYFQSDSTRKLDH